MARNEAVLSVRFNREVKAEADAVCREYGTALSGAIRMFVAQVAREKRIPLNITEPIGKSDSLTEPASDE